MHNDFVEFINKLNIHKAEFVIIGGMALAWYGFPRYTGDIDIWVYPDEENIARVFSAIEDFFDTELSVSASEFISGNNMITLGEEPVQIQLHIRLDGVTTSEIQESRVKGKFGSCDVFYIGRETFIKNKKAVGRPQDLVDIQKLGHDRHDSKKIKRIKDHEKGSKKSES